MAMSSARMHRSSLTDSQLIGNGVESSSETASVFFLCFYDKMRAIIFFRRRATMLQNIRIALVRRQAHRQYMGSAARAENNGINQSVRLHRPPAKPRPRMTLPLGERNSDALVHVHCRYARRSSQPAVARRAISGAIASASLL